MKRLLLALFFFLLGGTIGATSSAAEPSWSASGGLGSSRSSHTATLLFSGEVLVTGGFNGGFLSTAELYDPNLGSWKNVGAMEKARSRHTATLLPSGQVLVAGGFVLEAGEVSDIADLELYDPEIGAFRPGGSLTTARHDHTATLLPSGEILVVGGSRDNVSLGQVEIYDPTAEIGAGVPAQGLHHPRRGHTATLLPSGQVLLVGGLDSSGQAIGQAEIFDSDPDGPQWIVVDHSLLEPRAFHSATLLASGNVLITGGVDSDGNFLQSSELLVDDGWITVGNLVSPRAYQSAVLLPSGEVLVSGGSTGDSLASAEVYHPDSQAWARVADLANARRFHSSTLLASGRVLAAGGENTGAGEILFQTEIYDPRVVELHTADDVSARRAHTATLFPSGEVLVVGGFGIQGALDSTQLYDPASGEWTAPQDASPADLEFARGYHTATRLLDGKVLVVGGTDGNGGYRAQAELYDPMNQSWETVGELSPGRASHTATLLPSGEVLVAGGFDGDYLDDAQLYNPVTKAWQPVDPLRTARIWHTATLLPSGEVLVVGGLGSQLITDVEIFDPMDSTWSSAGSLTISRYDHSATLLASGEVLLAGGINIPSPHLTAVEIFDPKARRGRLTSPLSTPRVDHTATLLPSGQVFVAGGSAESQALGSLELFTPGTERWTDAGVLDSARSQHTATLLRSGKILITGGADGPPEEPPLSSVETVGLEKPPATRLPVIETAPTSLHFGQDFAISGDFRGDSEAGDGSGQSSAINFPIVTLRSLDRGEAVRLLPDARAEAALGNFWDTPLTVPFDRLPASLHPGPHWLTVTVAGVESDPELVTMECSIGISAPQKVAPLGLPAVGDSVTLTVESHGIRQWQWQKEGVPILGADGPTYATDPINGSDTGSEYRVVASNHCTDTTSEPFILEIADEEDPSVGLVTPRGGEYWTLTEPEPDGSAPEPLDEELIVWEMGDDIRICRVVVKLSFSNDGGRNYSPVDWGPVVFGDGGACSEDDKVVARNVAYPVPISHPSDQEGSLYKVEVIVTDHAGNSVHDESDPFFIVKRSTDTVKTLILANLERMRDPRHGGITMAEKNELEQSLAVLAEHQKVSGLLVDLNGIADLTELYAAWDAQRDDSTLANQVLFGDGTRAGIHQLVRELKDIYTQVDSVVLVGDDRILPMARVTDGTRLLPESFYTAGPDLTVDGSSVGEALAADKYLTDDPLAVLDEISVGELNADVFLPDLAIGRLVETPSEIITTIATFIGTNGVLDLGDLDSETGHIAQITGYDFLKDSAKRIRRRWQNLLGVTPPIGLAPVDGELIKPSWTEQELKDHLCGNGGPSYGLINLNGHATHYQEGHPGSGPFDIQGLEASELVSPAACGNGPLDLSGSIVFAVGCHGGLSVAGSEANDADHTLDLPQAFLSRGALAYVANSGYGWGLKHGVGYAERLVELFSEEISRTDDDLIRVGDAVLLAKQRYFMEAARPDPYDEKTLMQWTLFGLPMAAVRNGFAAPDTLRTPASSPPPKLEDLPSFEDLGSISVQRLPSSAGVGKSPIPPYLISLTHGFNLSAEGIYRLYNTSGDECPEPMDLTSCPAPDPGDPVGFYYSLNGVEFGSGSTGDADRAIQPYFVYDSRLSGTSQHGVLWLGGEYREITDWTPILAELVSNEPYESDPGPLPRMRRSLPHASRTVPGQDPVNGRPSDRELNRLVVTTGELLKESQDDPYSIERIYRQMDLEVFYFNHPTEPEQNRDRTGPVLTGFDEFEATTVKWKVSASDEDSEVWRVVVVYDRGVDPGSNVGRWAPIELTLEDDGFWHGSLTVDPESRLTYIVQAVDTRGNVSALEPESTQLPASGIELGLPLAVDVDIPREMTDLKVTLQANPQEVQAGHPVIYTVKVENDGPAASQVQLLHQLPPEVGVLPFGDPNWSCDGAHDLTCTLPLLADGGVSRLHIPVIAPSETGTIVSRVSVTAEQHEEQPSDNSDELPIDVIMFADLGIEIDNGLTEVCTGDTVTYTITVNHLGGAQIDNLSLDVMPTQGLESPDWHSENGIYDSDKGEWSGLALAEGGTATLTLSGAVAGDAVGPLLQDVALTSIDSPLGARDPVSGNDEASDSDPICDATAPRVEHLHSVASSGGGVLEDQELTQAAITQLLVLFSEPVNGADVPGAYGLFAAGADGIFQSSNCDLRPQGDDIFIQTVASYSDQIASLELPSPLPRGIYRLFVCSSIQDATGNPLSQSAHDFLVDVEHLLDHPNFDGSLAGWQTSGDLAAMPQYSTEDADQASSSGSASAFLSAGDSAGLSQCLAWGLGSGLTFGGKVRISSAEPATPEVRAKLEAFGSTDCSGMELMGLSALPIEGDTAGDWQAMIEDTGKIPTTAQSVLFSIEAENQGGSAAEVRIDDVFLYWGRIFGDGFESGDTSAWSN